MFAIFNTTSTIKKIYINGLEKQHIENLIDDIFDPLSETSIFISDVIDIKNLSDTFSNPNNEVLELNNLFTSTHEITLSGNILTNDEKEKALQILKIHFEK